MQEYFKKEVESLKTNLIKMASIVDEMVDEAIVALDSGNIDDIKNIKSKDREVDAYDNLIQTQCENVIALFQPVASDLRFVMSALMINNQLERCGDIAVNISKRIKKTNEYNSLIKEAKILEMGTKAKDMLKKAIDSFIHNDSSLAEQVLKDDDTVDELNKQIFNFLIDRMKVDNSTIQVCSHLIILAKQIERLADHATNIAENLVFYTDAKIISHRKKLGIEN
jgi:phosphate transport system protein